jgi:hypothetical protein
MKKAISNICILLASFMLIVNSSVYSQNYNKIEWLSTEEFEKCSIDDVSKILQGKWLYIYRSCPWSEQEIIKNEERQIEFYEGNTANEFYNNIKSENEFKWKVKETSKGYFSMEINIEHKNKLFLQPFDLKGRIVFSKDYNYISFSNNIEIDGGCLVCFERVIEKSE